jgi:hypothetical protein
VGETTRRVEDFLTRGFVAGLYQKQLAFRFLERSTGVSPVCTGVLFGFDKRKQMDQSPHGRDGHAPSFAMQSPISKRHWYYFLLRGPVLLCSIGEHLLKIRPRVTRYQQLATVPAPPSPFRIFNLISVCKASFFR